MTRQSSRDLTSAALDEARRAIARLRPLVLDDLGLGPSLESLANTVVGPEVDVEIEGGTTGSQKTTSVPPSSLAWMSQMPPATSARSRMLVRPWWPGDDLTGPGPTPTPSSMPQR